MSQKTNRDLIEGLKELKNRGSMTVKDVDLLENVITLLEEHEKLEKKEDKLRSGTMIVEMLARFLTNRTVVEIISEKFSDLIDKLL